MQTFILLTRLVDGNGFSFPSIEKREKAVTDNIRKSFPMVRWLHDYVTPGPWDYVDIFEAPDIVMAMKVSTLVRYYGGAHTEIWPVIGWRSFEAAMHGFEKFIEHREKMG